MVCSGGEGGSSHQLILITLGRPQLLNFEVYLICCLNFLTRSNVMIVGGKAEKEMAIVDMLENEVCPHLFILPAPSIPTLLSLVR